MPKNAQRLSEIFIDFEGRLDKIDAQMKVLDNSVKNQAQKIEDEFDKKVHKGGKRAFDRLGDAGTRALQRLGTAAVRYIKYGVVAAIGGMTAAIAKAVTTSARFETMKLRLEQLLGSAEKADEAFKRYARFGAETPWKLGEVIESVATLESFGASAEKLIRPISDLAVMMGTTLPEAASAFGRAFAGGVGAADIFRETGVLNRIREFKKIPDLTKLSLQEFRKAMIETLTDPDGRIAGGTEKLAGTLEGRWSTFQDNIELIFKGIGDQVSGPAKDKLNEWISALDKFIASGQLEYFGQRVQQVFATTLTFIESAIKKLDEFFGFTLQGNIRAVENRIKELETSLSKGEKPLTLQGVLDSFKTPESKKNELAQLRFALRLMRIEQERLNKAAQEGANGPGVGANPKMTPSDIEDLSRKGIVGRGKGAKLPDFYGAKQEYYGKPLQEYVDKSNQAPELFGAKQEFLAKDIQKGLDYSKEQTEKIKKDVEKAADYTVNMAENMVRMGLAGRNFGDILKATFAEASIELGKMLAKMLLIRTLTGGFGINLGRGTPGLDSGNELSFASGAHFIVPAGSNPGGTSITVHPREDVNITPAAKVGQETRQLAGLQKSFNAMNANLMDLMTRQEKIEAYSNVTPRGVELLVRKRQILDRFTRG